MWAREEQPSGTGGLMLYLVVVRVKGEMGSAQYQKAIRIDGKGRERTKDWAAGRGKRDIPF